MSSDNRSAIAELVMTVALPAFCLIVLTDEERLGPAWGLVVALVPPIVWGVGSMVRQGEVSALAVVALVSVLLTGGVGLLELDAQWFAVKEAAVPAALGLAVMATARTRFALVPILLDRLFDLDKARSAAHARGRGADLRRAMARATVAMGGILVASGGLNFLLARWLVASPTGSEAFGVELGRYTLISLPALLVPTTLGMAFVLSRVLAALEDTSGAEHEEFLR